MADNVSAELELYQQPPLDERGLALIEREAAILAKSSLVGPALRGKPDDVVLVGINAHALGVPLTTGITDLFPIDGRISISARLRVGLARRAGHEVWFDESTDERATCCLRRRGETRIHDLTYTIEQARTAKLATKDNWAKHPAAMLRAAAARQLVNVAAQEVMLGIPSYISDAELEAAGVDVDLDQPDGLGDDWQPSPADAPIRYTSDEDKATLRQRLNDLKPHQREWLHADARIPGTDPPRYRLCNIAKPQMQASEAAAWDAMLLAAENRVEPEDDPGRPFE